MKGTALSHGAATIVNAIATGKGAAFGITLKTRATIELNDSGRFKAKIEGHPEEDTTLISLCAKKVIGRFGLGYGASIRTESDIPIAAGLKSSSTAANAVVLATYGAIRKEKKVIMKDQEILNLAVDSALQAKVTITGAYDDAAASYYGGYVVTDNLKRKIMKKGRMDSKLNVIIFVPDKKSYTAQVDVKKTKVFSKEILSCWKDALGGNLYKAMNLNSLLYCATLGCDTRIPQAALEAGAIASGLSGKGPATVALTKKDPEKIIAAWEGFDGKIIQAGINNRKAYLTD